MASNTFRKHKSNLFLQVHSYDLHAAIDRAARTGRGLPQLGRTPDTSYEPSEKSNITDLGTHERELAYQKTDTRHAPTQSPPPHHDIRVQLQNRLLEIIQKIPGHEERKGFFPEQQLAELVTEEYTKKELHESLPCLDASQVERLAKKICGTADTDGKPKLRFKKIFTILVLCEKLEDILRFLEEEVSDYDLPLCKVAFTDGSQNIFNLARKGHQDELECFRGWSSAAIWRFEEWQWTTLAPFFHHGKRKDVKHFILPDQVPLPFSMDSRFPSRDSSYKRLEFEGGFSNVFKAGLHPEHHDLYKPGVSCWLMRTNRKYRIC